MSKDKPLLTTTDAILAQLKFIRTKKQEYFVCLSLDSAQRLIARRVVTIGTLTGTLVHPREVFAGPLKDRAASIIVTHNHPSGDPSPSNDDIGTTQQLVAAGLLLGVRLHDHIIITSRGYYSFQQDRLL
ncbi:MAG TPA: JAB domain-containing protein [Candidatus Saccharimonadales bacterium]|nr:JAB domain-containing protein [Candidatus Saccharimonadales bacterium]